MASYQTIIRNLLAEIDLQEQFKRDTILKAAQALERENFPVEKINSKISEDVESRISKQYVGKVLEGTKYKDVSKIHRKKKVVEVTLDGMEIESDYEKEQRERGENEARELFDNMNKRAEEGSKEIQSLDKAVLQELDNTKEENKQLKINQKLMQNSYEMKLKVNEDLIDYIQENLGFYMVFDKNEDDEIYCKQIDSEKAELRGEIRIDLIEFEDKIKESYKQSKISATLKHDGKWVTSWTWN